ncbi:MAG: glycosyltransferase family 2 protein [Chthoniobacterales bacterium]
MNSISIIIPAYNAAATLRSTIESCLDQMMVPLEIIVVDDGSSDETAAIATSFEKEIRYFYLENGGVSRARNYGASQAKGTWLLFLDADDQLLPHAMTMLLEEALKQQAGVAYGMVIERQEPPRKPRLSGFDYAAGIPPQGAQHIFWRNAIITPGSAIVRAELHAAIGGFVTGYEPMEDRDYWIKCALSAPVAFCDTVVLDKKWFPGSHGSQESKRIYRGQIAQRALKEWAREQHISTEWMPTDRAIIKSALDEAVWRRRYDVLKPLLAEAKHHGLSHWKASLIAILSSKKNKVN